MYTVATPRKHTLSEGESARHHSCACITRMPVSRVRGGQEVGYPCWWEEGFLRELSSDCQMVVGRGRRGV